VIRQAIALFVGVFLFTQLQAEAGRYFIDAWSTEKGLPDNFVTSLAQTPEGYLWVGTYNGLARFDGVRFVTFNPANTPQLEHTRIVKLFLDAQGELWINTYDGSLTSWRNGVFTTEWSGKGRENSEAWLVSSNASRIVFAFRSGLLISRSVAAGSDHAWHVLAPPGDPPGVFYCEDQAGVLWCSTLDNKLWRIHNDQYELMGPGSGLCGKEAHWLATDAAKQLWVGTEKGIARWDGQRFKNMTPEGEPKPNVSAMFFTQDGGALITDNGKLRKYLNRQWAAETPAGLDLQQEQQLWPVLYQDRAGGFWQTSRGKGLIHTLPDGSSQDFTIADGLPSDHVTCWLQDREGNVWVGLGRGGLARLRERHFAVLGMPNGLPIRPAVSVSEDGTGALWMGTYGGGLNCWRNGVLTNYPLPRQSSGGFVFSTFPDSQGRLWISAGLEDLYVIKGGQLLPAPVAVHGIKSILVDHQDRVWLGTKDGLACWADGKLRKFNKRDSHCESIANPVRALAEDQQGRIWIGADDGNIYRFDEGNLRAFPLPQFSAHQQAVWSLQADTDGSLWVGTSDAGLLHFANDRFTRFTASDGLPDDIICQILDDQHGNLWIGSHQGIFRVGKTALNAFATHAASGISCSVYDLSDGLPSLQCSEMYQPSAWRGQDGKLWFATAKGVVAVQPGEVPVNLRPPPVAIEEFLADGNSQALAAGHNPANGTAVLEVPPGKQNFEFHYTALLLTDAEKIRFRYKLEGFDAGWVNAGAARAAHYNYLKPGSYLFHVIAANNDGVWNEVGASVVLKVLPYFWETWWFLALLGLALLIVVAGVARHLSQRELRRELEQLERQRDLEQDRSRIARDIHDHIGSGLTRINLLNELLLGDPAGLQAVRVGQITSVTCELMRAMDEIVWAVDPHHDTLDSLMSYLCDFAEEYLRPTGMRLRINLPTPLPPWPLTSEARHNLYLAIQEVLNNIVKHSQATEVYFGLELAAEAAILEIRDNGRGFLQKLDHSAEARPTNGNGLKNLQQRAVAIGGRCFINSGPGQGTRIELVVPRPK